MGLPKSSIKAYLCDWRGRPWAMLAGILCGLGNGFQFMCATPNRSHVGTLLQPSPCRDNVCSMPAVWQLLRFVMAAYSPYERLCTVLLAFNFFFEEPAKFMKCG